MNTASVIVLIADDGRLDCPLRDALQTAAPDSVLGVVRSRQELQALGTPAVIVLDLMLAHEPPFEVLRWLRAQQRFETIPIFALGSDVLKQDISRAYAMGVNSCFLRTTGTEDLGQMARGLAGYASLVLTN